jgi:hypothetical protein
MYPTLLPDERFDVIVAGAGPAGVAAAVAAGRQGAKTLLVERYGCAGGAMTLGLALTPVGFEPFKYWCDDTDPEKWKVQGIPRDVYDRCMAMDGVVKPVWDPEVFKIVIDRMLQEAGVKILFHAMAVDTLMEGDRVVGLVLAAREGLVKVEAPVVVDCTGDGDVFAKAGAAFDFGRAGDNRPQPMAVSCIFGGVDLGLSPEMPYALMMASTMASVTEPVAAAVESGALPPILTGYWFPRVVRGRVLLDQMWTRLVQAWGDPNVTTVMSDAELSGRDTVHRVHDWLKENVPGFGRSYLSHMSWQMWPRESRRLRGLQKVTAQHVRDNKLRDDGIGKGTCFFEVRNATPGEIGAEDGLDWDQVDSLFFADIEYDIPYGALVPQKVDGLLVAGRCMSVTHIAQGSSRMQITSMATGEAAGTAAALAAAGKMQPREVPIETLRETLRKGGAIV